MFCSSWRLAAEHDKQRRLRCYMTSKSKIPKITDNRMRLIAVLATLAVAVVAIVTGNADSSIIFSFLALVIASLLGQVTNRE
jgi:hypothetical protein